MKYTFLLLGDNRSGTTSIWSFMRYHKQIAVGIVKERLHRLPIDTPNLSFYIKDNFSTTSKTKILLDGSPNIISFRPTFIDMIKDIPEINRLCCLYTVRPPIERLYSYSHLMMVNYRKGREGKPYFIKEKRIDHDSLRYFLLKDCTSYWKMRLIEKKIGKSNLLPIQLDKLSDNIHNIFNFLDIDDDPIPFGKINRSIDHAPNIEQLKLRSSIENWVCENSELVDKVNRLDSERIKGRYGI